MMMELKLENEFTVGSLPARSRDFKHEWGIVLGSGLGPFVDRLKIVESIPYTDIRGLPVSTVPGHAGRFALAELDKTRVIVAQGRVHLYEGHTAAQVTAGIRVMSAL